MIKYVNTKKIRKTEGGSEKENPKIRSKERKKKVGEN